MKMYVVVSGKRKGPLAPEDVRDLYASGRLQAQDLSWRSGMSGWRPLSETWPDLVAANGTSTSAAEAERVPTNEVSVGEVEPTQITDAASPTVAVQAESVTEADPTAQEDEVQAEEAEEAEGEADSSEAALQATVAAIKPEAMPPPQLYVAVAGERRGPMSVEETMELCRSRELRREALAWKSGLSEWKRLDQVWPESGPFVDAIAAAAEKAEYRGETD